MSISDHPERGRNKPKELYPMTNDWLLNAYRNQGQATGAQPHTAEMHDGHHNNWGKSEGCEMGWRDRYNAGK